MSTKKSKSDLDRELNEALQETFPGSDAIAVDATGDAPVRPVNRKPPIIDKDLVDQLAKKAKEQNR
jgi:hypothetical protein